MSRTGDMAIDAQVRDEMARVAGPELAKALRSSLLALTEAAKVFAVTEYRGMGEIMNAHADQARSALRKAGLEP